MLIEYFVQDDYGNRYIFIRYKIYFNRNKFIYKINLVTFSIYILNAEKGVIKIG